LVVDAVGVEILAVAQVEIFDVLAVLVNVVE